MKLRGEDRLHPEVEWTLKALDAALAGGPVEPDLAELRDLALALRAERPAPPPAFRAELDDRAATGFRKPPRRAKTPRRLVPLALGTGAAAFIAAAVVFSGTLSGGGGNDRGTSDGAHTASRPGAAAPAQELRMPSRSNAQPLSTPSGRSSGGVAPRARVRKVERAASITLAAPKDEIEDVADGAIRTADRYGGFVLDSSVSSGEGKAGATIDLRIPSSRLEDAIADLSNLAHVRARSQRALDITARFTSPRRRLADAKAERRALLVELARADTPNETASVRARLKLVDNRIDAARATLRRLENRVDYAAVSVSIEPGGKADASAWSVGDAFADALGVLEVAFGVLVVGIAVLLPLALVLATAWAGRRAYVRRARNAALGAVENVTGR
jgi:uncharacterized protein DUF4349